MDAASLGTAALPGLAARGIGVPAYDRAGLQPGVLHLGLGAFHRAHQALVFDRLLAGGDRRWGVLGVAMRNPALAQVLDAQDGLYAVEISDAAGSGWQVGGAIVRTLVAAMQAEAVHAAIASPALRWITLTVTEKGYAAPLAQLLAIGLAKRRAAGLRGLTIASCDNLAGNGSKLQALVIEAARSLPDANLAGWIATTCAFPHSMVDRIVPAATPARLDAARLALGVADGAALGTEGFWEWVLEDRLADPGDAALLAAAGVQLVPDVRPFEEAKLRMLNGSHSAMACMGAVAGWPTIADCVGQPAVRAFIHGLMTQELAPHLRRPGLDAYRDALLARFANPSLRHSVHQIASDSSQKIPQRWPPSVAAGLAAGTPVDRLAFAAAAFMRWCLGTDERGQPIPMNDPMAPQLQALARTHAHDVDASVRALGGLPAVWGSQLPADAAWQARVAGHLQRIHAQGVARALDHLLETPTP